MSLNHPKYDVAISFLSQDEKTARAINDKLAEGLRVFFYPGKQDELAGTDGLESMRKPFFDDSRVTVVLYREPWGKTPWTRVEETAIKEGCLAHGWQRLFFIVLNRESAIPIWLPQNHIRFNYADFGLDQAVGAIKARVQENGGQQMSLTPTRRAEMFKAEELYRHDKGRMNSPEGIQRILDSVSDLFCEIERQCEAVKGEGMIQMRCGIEFIERNRVQWCGITDDRVGLTVSWNQFYTNSLAHSGLVVREFGIGIIIPGETGRIYLQEPEVV